MRHPELVRFRSYKPKPIYRPNLPTGTPYRRLSDSFLSKPKPIDPDRATVPLGNQQSEFQQTIDSMRKGLPDPKELRPYNPDVEIELQTPLLNQLKKALEARKQQGGAQAPGQPQLEIDYTDFRSEPLELPTRTNRPLTPVVPMEPVAPSQQLKNPANPLNQIWQKGNRR